METIVHRIRLRSGVAPERFEAWVTGVDYTTCPQLPSVLQFSVHRVSVDERATFHYLEVIVVRDQEEFARDMRDSIFVNLSADFGEMAEVVNEDIGTYIEPGYQVSSWR